MSNIWPHATKEHPCPICLKTDWCQFGDRAVKCMRVDSPHSCPSGGWYHFDEAAKSIPKRVDVYHKATIDAPKLMAEYWSKTTSEMIERYALHIGVSIRSLLATGAAFCHEKNAWAFPMKDGNGNTIGIRLRTDNFKWAVPGSRQGIFIPDASIQSEKGLALIPEGPTSTAACLSLGYFTIGRPNARCGFEFVGEACRRLGIYRVAIIADNDKMDKMTGKRVGIQAAMDLKKHLKLSSIIIIPPSPCKDIRDVILKLGIDKTKSIIEADMKSKVWCK